MKPNPDNRRDNVENIQKNIDNTISNIRKANEVIDKTSDETLKEDLSKKNERREQALNSLRHEIKDEAEHQNRSRS